MTLTINDQNNQARKTRRQIEQRLKEQDELIDYLYELRQQDELIDYLYELRLQCQHDFEPAQKDTNVGVVIARNVESVSCIGVLLDQNKNNK